ncbi:MAG: Hpt domain-containing protein [Caldilineaceae bacterium]|nr:Hpt domain-containing protein [Caldilineaceae bacterium]
MINTDGLQHPINFSILKELEDAVAVGIPEIMIDLLDTYLVDSGQTFQKMCNAVDEGNVSLVEINAHALKSSSATFGAEVLALFFANIEDLAHNGKLPEISLLLGEVRQKSLEVDHALSVERQRLLGA